MNVEMRVHILRTFITHPLVYIHQKKKNTLEIAETLRVMCVIHFSYYNYNNMLLISSANASFINTFPNFLNA